MIGEFGFMNPAELKAVKATGARLGRMLRQLVDRLAPGKAATIAPDVLAGELAKLGFECLIYAVGPGNLPEGMQGVAYGVGCVLGQVPAGAQRDQARRLILGQIAEGEAETAGLLAPPARLDG